MKRIFALTILTAAVALAGCKPTIQPADVCAPVAAKMVVEYVSENNLSSAVDTSGVHGDFFNACQAGARLGLQHPNQTAFEQAFTTYRAELMASLPTHDKFVAALKSSNAFIAGFHATGAKIPGYEK